ncbi:MAG: FtsQ-type POTRA domain-containing protein [Nitrospirae bacterium]|nr:FtsQ-type POTRA domain-containing protein [Nitrospirota bacterium]
MRRVVIFLLVSALIITVSVYISGTIRSVFPIKHFVFSGNKHLTDDELKILAGLYGGEGLITISSKEVSQRLLKSPWIRSVSLRKEFPETLSVVIEEAVPLALLDMNGHLFLIDDNGKLLEELKDEAVPFLPIITGDPFKERGGFSEALNLINVMKGKGLLLGKDHIEINAQRPQELAISIDGIIVKVGAGGYQEKLERLIELEDEIKRRNTAVDYIDLRFANRVILKPIKEVVK